MKNFSFSFVIVAFLLSGCGGTILPSSPDDLISQHGGGPDVESMDEIWLKTAEESYAKREYGKAADMYQQLLAKNPDKLEYLLKFAQMKRRFGEYDLAKKSFKLYLDKKPGQVDAMEGLGLTLLALGEIRESVQLLTKVVEKDAGRWQTLNAIGIAYGIQGETKEAISYYKNALEFSPRNASVLNNLGLSFAINSEYDKAIRSLKHALNNLPSSSPHREKLDMNLAMIYGASGDIASAEKIAKQYMSGAALANNLGFYARLSENPKLARSYLHSSLNQSEKYYDKAWENLQKIEPN
jgi:Flp pilus assembly protein TadD